jgi:hypothetical protein
MKNIFVKFLVLLFAAASITTTYSAGSELNLAAGNGPGSEQQSGDKNPGDKKRIQKKDKNCVPKKDGSGKKQKKGNKKMNKKSRKGSKRGNGK